MGQELYKNIYGTKELYVALYKGIRTFKYMRKNKKMNRISSHFIERIMLAVTEVNGCEVCSYAHTKIALEQGMSEKEIKMLLSGITEGISEGEMTAIVFAQHYADTRGNPSKEAWNRVVKVYGTEKALGILGVIRTIMIGNIYGIALSAFRSRIKGKKIEKTTLFYEIKMIMSIIPLLPAALIHAFISNRFKIDVIDFNGKQSVKI
ncbi:carboxymuconolactone decarboxylase family protein [Sporosarcina luteola]|uniref:carboxymuconolactone decarboxylase family protein n=1 Tax=Sporosarcina luteola TaxID=582850 RepID=UPI00203D2AE2|nr:carboxymuconolactone decarboxylase family protein [Sporosarcina luteola]MCM3745197.1 carboxymuconolactone decarboxylase family protein [Sporosarcina luteola]